METKTAVPVRVAGELIIKIEDLPVMALEQIKSALTIANEEREKAASLKQFGFWDMPETVALWRTETRRGDGEVLCLPRGFAAPLRAGMAAMGLDLEWDDRRTTSPAAEGYFRPFLMRDYQLAAAMAMLQHEQGVYKAPAGCVSGDTDLRFNRAGKGFKRDIADAYRRFNGLEAKSWDRSIPTYCRALVDGIYRQHLVEDIVYSGLKETIEIELESGKKICCTIDHGILKKDGWVSAGSLQVGETVTVNGKPVQERSCVSCGSRFHQSTRRIYPSNPRKHPDHCGSCRGRMATAKIVKDVIKDKDGYLQERCFGHPRANSHGRVLQHILVAEAVIGRSIGVEEHVHHKNHQRDDNWPHNLEVVTPAEHHRIHRGFLKMDGGTAGRGGKIIFLPKYEKVVSIKPAGMRETYDMVMHDPHNNFVANGIVVHNSGKTVTTLGMAAYANQRTLIVVDKAGLVEQWRARAAQFFGLEMEEGEGGRLSASLKGDRSVGKIGEDVWEERDLTICLRQTLHSRGWELDATKWWGTWGLVVFDEVHHLSSETMQQICRKITAKNLFGVSATPAKSEARGATVYALAGPIIHETTRQELYDRGVLMKSTVQVIHGDFYADFHPDHESDSKGNCEAAGCKKTSKHKHRNNYSSVLKKLVEDEGRNQRIAKAIFEDRGQVHLVPSRQLKHLNLIRRELLDLGWPEEKIFLLRGEENAAGMSQTIAKAVEDADEAVVLSTVADEALDIPPISRTHIVFPMRQEGATIQLVGRGERVWPGKTEAIVKDWHEPLVEVFRGQFSERDRCYRMAGYDIEHIEVQ